MAKVDLNQLFTNNKYKAPASDLRVLAKELQDELHGEHQLSGEELRIFNTLNGVEMCRCGSAIHSNGRCFTHLNS